MKSILNLEYPVIGLAPMDGVTDNTYRFITKKFGKADIMFTEFTNVMGLCIAGQNLLKAFHYDESQRPIIGQLYGKEPEYFYHASKMLCALGFDGIDINMGCPAKTVTAHGSGAGLIRTPELAKEIIKSVKQGVQDWVNNGELTGLTPKSLRALEELILKYRDRIKNDNIIIDKYLKGKQNLYGIKRDLVSVSVKTRTGYDVPITEKWITDIASVNPNWITLHGRTLKQMYTGEANWDEIKIAVESTSIPLLANGDVRDALDVSKILEHTKAKGVLIGRGSYGNPWIFNNARNILNNVKEIEPSLEDKIKVLLLHTQKFVEENPDEKAFFQMRKHFGWYIKGFENAKEIREKLMRANNLKEVKYVLTENNI